MARTYNCPNCKQLLSVDADHCPTCRAKQLVQTFSCPDCKGVVNWNAQQCPHCLCKTFSVLSYYHYVGLKQPCNICNGHGKVTVDRGHEDKSAPVRDLHNNVRYYLWISRLVEESCSNCRDGYHYLHREAWMDLRDRRMFWLGGDVPITRFFMEIVQRQS